MTAGTRHLAVAVVAALGALGAAATSIGAQTGSVTGFVFDSIHGAPLDNAAVFLWDTPFRADTGPAGHFRIDDVPAGEYSILFFHTSLGRLGVSPGQRSLTVPRGGVIDIELATPSLSTVVTSQCLMEARDEDTGAIAGHVTDGDTEMDLSGAYVTLSWDDPAQREPRSVELVTDSEGWYRTCNVPTGVPLLLAAQFVGRQGLRREVSVPDHGFTEAAVRLFPTRTTRVSGHLVDATSEESVEGAEAWLRGTSHRTLTNGDGGFRFEDVVPGTYMLMTEHLVYGTKMDTLVVPSGDRITVEMRLHTRPIEIAPLTVTAEAPPAELARARGGIVIDPDDLDRVRQRSRDASDMLRSLHVPGVVVRHHSNGTICVGYSTGQVKMNQNGCVSMLIYINDVRATDPNLALRIPPEAIERMVLYKPVQAGNLFGLGGGNGVWMIYTRGN